LIDVVCQEFGCLPCAAERELDENFERVMDVLFVRMYARVKAQIEAAKTADDQPTGPLADLVRETEVDVWRERRRTRDA
jgi:hypothetical protein